MTTTTQPDLCKCTGERLLLLRILQPHLKGLIEQELNRRVLNRVARTGAHPVASLRFAHSARVA